MRKYSHERQLPFFLNKTSKALVIAGIVTVSAAPFLTGKVQAQTATATPEPATVIIDSNTGAISDPLKTAPTPPVEEAPISLFPSEESEIFAEENRENGENADTETPPNNPVVETVPANAILTEEELGVVDPATIGLYSGLNGGLGVDMWAGSSRDSMKQVFSQLPERLESSALQELAGKLLLSQAETPAYRGDDPDFDLIADGIDVIKQRAQLLVNLGQSNKAQELILSAGLNNEQLVEFVDLLAEIALQENENSQLCSLVQNQHDKLGEPFWQKSLIFCNMLAGNQESAQFGVTMLQDIGEGDDLFFALIDRLSGYNTELPEAEELSSLHLALYQAAGVSLPEGLLSDSASPSLLKAIIKNDKTSIEIRLHAAEQAASIGLIDGEVLAALYLSVPATLAELQAPITTAETAYNAHARAVLYQAAESDTVPETRVIIIKQALDFARRHGHYGMALATYQSLISQLQITGDMWHFAGDAARALYAIGRPKPAQAWISHLSDQAIRNPDAERNLLELWALSRLNVGEASVTIDEEAGNKVWQDYILRSVGEGPEAEVVRRIALTYALLNGLDRPMVTESAWHDLSQRDVGMITLTPNPAHLHLMSQAALDGKKAETVGWALKVMGSASLSQISADAIKNTIQALRVVGLNNEAQALALDVALANGL